MLSYLFYNRVQSQLKKSVIQHQLISIEVVEEKDGIEFFRLKSILTGKYANYEVVYLFYNGGQTQLKKGAIQYQFKAASDYYEN